MTKTERIINGIKKNDSFENVAYVCEDFETFVIEVAEWGCLLYTSPSPRDT